jgi:hypothetical protein
MLPGEMDPPEPRTPTARTGRVDVPLKSESTFGPAGPWPASHSDSSGGGTDSWT